MPSSPPAPAPLHELPGHHGAGPAIGARKGRGTVWAMAHRFQTDSREAVDDGWGDLAQGVERTVLPPATEVMEERVKSILSTNEPKSGSYPVASSAGGGFGGPMTGAMRSLM